MVRRWTEEEWDELYGLYPPVKGQRPDRAACVALARKFDRTPDGILWMWGDAVRYLSGMRATTTSERLKDYLDSRR